MVVALSLRGEPIFSISYLHFHEVSFVFLITDLEMSFSLLPKENNIFLTWLILCYLGLQFVEGDELFNSVVL